jgi:GH24 family phage-related lysozyme (muramidase)
MSAVELALPRLKIEEGFRALPYLDTNGLETVGYGFCVQKGISKYAAAALLQAQAEELQAALLGYPWYAALNDVRRSVCLDIAVNEGLGGLLKFPSMIHALSAGDWTAAAHECHVADPKLAGRYAALAQLLLTGAA